MYNPYDHYWLANDLRVFASRVPGLIPDTDPTYVEWFTVGNLPTPWPVDEDGNQTLAELQRVLFEYKITVDLKAYAFMVRDQKEHGGTPVTGVVGVTEIRTDPYTQNLISRYQAAATADAGFTAPWVLPDRSTVTLTMTSIGALYTQLTTFIVGTYTTYSEVIAGIDGGTITTSAQIDTAFGQTLVRSSKVDIGWKS